jgi:hypothetical protein
MKDLYTIDGLSPRLQRDGILPDHSDGGVLLDRSLERLSPSPEITFGTVAERNLLFSESDQRIFEINNIAAYIWCSLREGCGYEVIVTELADRGIPLETARTYLKNALLEWSRKGFLKRSHVTVQPALHETLYSQNIGLAAVPITVHYRTGLFCEVAAVFQHLQTEEATPDVTLDVVEKNKRVELFRNGKWVFSAPADELATVLKGQLLEEALARANYELALHAATLVRNERMMLLSGHPGAGKTTLTLALVDAGFGFAGDDVALLSSDSRVTGIPFAPACKAGSWRLISQYRPDIENSPIFRRCDRRRVRYPALTGLVPSVPRSVGWVIFLDRRGGESAGLIRIDPVSAVQGMLRESYARGRRLMASGFTSILRVVERAECYRLVYSELEDAVDLLCRRCR